MSQAQPDSEAHDADRRAVGSVVGALLMVAVTVVIAVALGAFVLAPGVGTGTDAPEATFEYSFSDGGDGFGDTNDRIRITYVEGPPLDAESIRVVVDGERVEHVPEYWSTEIGPGESIVITDDGTDADNASVSTIQSGDGILVIWDGPEDDVVISSVEVP